MRKPAFAALIFCGCAFAADPQLLNMAPPDAKVFAGINVDQAKTSPFAQFLLTNLPMDSSGLQEFVDATGFDPRRDLHEILVASSGLTMGKTGAPHTMTGLVLAKGAFNIPQILSAAAKDGKVTASTYAGAQLITVEEGDHPHALAFIDSNTAVAGDLSSVQGALDRRSKNNALDPALMARINDLSTSEDAWSVSTGGFGALLPAQLEPNNPSAVLANIKEASGGIKFGAQVQLDVQATTGDPKDATALSDVIKLLGNMAQMNLGGNGAPDQLVSLLKSLNVSTEGTTVKISLSIPENDLETLVESAHHPSETADKI